MTQKNNLLCFKSDGSSLGATEQCWKLALTEAQPDPTVKIKHASLGGDPQYRLHVAAIPEKVGCHFHAHGDEDYAIVSGKGTLHWGKVETTTSGPVVAWEVPIDVKAGDSFVIPERYAHQLVRRGTDDLIIVFGCPDSHLDDKIDRTLLADASSGVVNQP